MLVLNPFAGQLFPQIHLCWSLCRANFLSDTPLLVSLQGFDDQCLGFIGSHLRPAAFAKDEVVFECGDRGDEMYFVVAGAVLIHMGPLITLTTSEDQAASESSNQETSSGRGGGIWRDTGSVGGAEKGTRIVGKGDVFGECGLFTKELGLLRRESAKTQSWVSVYVLTAAALREVSLEYPEVSSWLLPNP
jgi:CRP-like cAMP-binding protein